MSAVPCLLTSSHIHPLVAMPPKGSRKVRPPLPIPGSSTFPGKPDPKTGLEAPQWEACRRILEGIYTTTEDGYVYLHAHSWSEVVADTEAY
jgi:hypothetical protein